MAGRQTDSLSIVRLTSRFRRRCGEIAAVPVPSAAASSPALEVLADQYRDRGGVAQAVPKIRADGDESAGGVPVRDAIRSTRGFFTGGAAFADFAVHEAVLKTAGPNSDS